MDNTLKYALREAAGIAGDTARFYAGALALPVIVPVAVAGVAALSAAALGSWIAGADGRVILSELRRRARLRAPHAPSPSLRGRPTPEEFASDAAVRPRTLAVRLRIGSRLADLAPTLDRGPRFDVPPTGSRRIRGRGRGLKGWLEDNRVGMGYSTLTSYMRLAVRLRALLALDDRLPLEWLLPGGELPAEIPAELQRQHATAKRKLARLLRDHRNFSRLRAYVDGALDLRRLPRPGRPAGQPLDDILADNVRLELADFLQARNLPPQPEALRREAAAEFLAPRQLPSHPHSRRHAIPVASPPLRW